jgi:FkbM family methyltransferase
MRFIRTIKKYLFTNRFAERVLFLLARKNKFFERLYPANTDYLLSTVRYCIRNGVKYQLALYDYQEYIIYFNIESDSSIPFLRHIPIVDGIFLDIGANIGHTAFNLAKLLVEKNVEIHAFEPFPRTFEKLKKNIDINNFNSIIIHNLAVGSIRDSIQMYIDCESNSGGNRVLSQTNGFRPAVSVEQIRIDDFEIDKTKVVFIKIDVEGYEMEVLKGANNLLSIYKPGLLVELCDKSLKAQHSSAKELVNYLKELGYTRIQNASNLSDVSNLDLEDCSLDILCLR